MVGAQHALDKEYFSRIDALNFIMKHGKVERVNPAEIFLVQSMLSTDNSFSGFAQI
ncbi:MAG: hypothetical protein QNJ29_12530 [Rhizobiaceae bacterium]|nr:hypothetical protein [Rhizobiaceae bacterium]